MDKNQPRHAHFENIAAVAKLEERFLQNRTTVDRISDVIGGFAGSMTFVALHVAIFAFWFLINSKTTPLIKPFDPYPFVLLSMVVSVEAVLLSTFVLMKQNRESKRAEQRQHLTLQIDLLAEQEATKTLQMLGRICEHLGIDDAASDRETQMLSQNTAVDQLSDDLNDKIPSV